MTRTAAVFIPWGQADSAQDGQYATQGVAHIERRGYRLGGIYRSWEQLEKAAATLDITVIVFVRASHFHPGCTMAAEFVGDETRRLALRAPAGLIFPSSEYRSKARNSLYETARLFPRGDDDGFAERFLKERSISRDT